MGGGQNILRPPHIFEWGGPIPPAPPLPTPLYIYIYIYNCACACMCVRMLVCVKCYLIYNIYNIRNIILRRYTIVIKQI